LTKELVELHHGTIQVESKPHKITTFTLLLPIGKEHFKEEEILTQQETGTWKSKTEKEISPKEVIEDLPVSGIRDAAFRASRDSREQESGIEYPASPPWSPVLLIVEDNPDVTSYVRGFMENDYRIITAIDGEEGWNKSLQKVPDLIISDVMMPVMDGFEFCKKLKSDQRTSHIPVILLTVKADLGSKIEGLEFGADDYISKPFEAKELHARAKNLINQRKALREKFSRMIEINPGEVAASSMDEKFIKHLLKVFEDHISEPDFSTELFAREIGMSRMHLNRKLRALTNHSTHQFIRTLRLKRAAQLLKKKSGSVSEIAYSLGFNSASHFAYAFRKQFGQPPTVFSEKEN
jgi:YesN/AraC family two-component response regulator